ncbi:hypothetical protein ACHHYP_02388 [Achlya hypogyna]|uniref:Prolyl 4-hydroxylase alpha subunit domain-containing protein n=1 Tax=Achlya hypogyna TaxID=1202772 RepID=A0A1V9Z6K4_ACHHY|nr:hypothetical protein ACHHYP_02388 [Achlya hypogyna]
MHMELQGFLPPQVSSSYPRIVSQMVPVHDALSVDVATLRSRGHVFVMLNGANDGIYVATDLTDLAAAASLAALALGADQDWVALGVRFFSPDGLLLTTPTDVDAIRCVHVLLEFQSWMWPGITVGHTYRIIEANRTISLTTRSLSPRVFVVSNFFTQAEADAIVAEGEPRLSASLVDLGGREVTSTHRTSKTAFLAPSSLSRGVQSRAAAVARLPSPSYAEQLHLVKYTTGTFYKPHLDTFGGKDILAADAPQGAYADFVAWTSWATTRLDALELSVKLPPAYKAGGALRPAVGAAFEAALLELFLAQGIATNFFKARYDEAWQDYLRMGLDDGSPELLSELLTARPEYLSSLIQAWQTSLDRFELIYPGTCSTTFDGHGQYFRWIRWLKDAIAHCADCASVAQPSGDLYPKFVSTFQDKLVTLLLADDVTLEAATNVTYAAGFRTKVDIGYGHDLLLDALKHFGATLLPKVIALWERRVSEPRLQYTLPARVPAQVYHPQRFATLFLYLNDVARGGATAFPFATGSVGDGCDGRGLAVQPRALEAVLFYVQTPDHQVDMLSRHGGCPPKGVKFGANAFLWNGDAEEGASLWLS